MVSTSKLILLCLWLTLTAYVFYKIKKAYDHGEKFPRKLLPTWFLMWGCHHTALFLASAQNLWLIPINKTIAITGGVVLIVMGGAFLVTGMIEFRSLRRSTGQDISMLVTTGIYRWSRNPQFVGWVIVLSGIALIGRSGLALALLIIFAIVIHFYTARMEEPNSVS